MIGRPQFMTRRPNKRRRLIERPESLILNLLEHGDTETRRSDTESSGSNAKPLRR